MGANLKTMHAQLSIYRNMQRLPYFLLCHLPTPAFSILTFSILAILIKVALMQLAKMKVKAPYTDGCLEIPQCAQGHDHD